MAKVIKEDAGKRHNDQKINDYSTDNYTTEVAYDVNKPSTAASITMSTSSSIPRNALVVLKKQVDIDRKMIEMAAYFKAEKRNFEPGNEVEDWLEAEAELGVPVT